MYLRFKVWSQQTSQKLTPHSAPECGPNFLLRGGLIVITDWLNSLAKCQKLASTQRVFPQGCCSSESVGTPTGSELRSHKSCFWDFLSVIVNLKCSNFKTLSSCSRDISVFGITLCLSKSYLWEKKIKLYLTIEIPLGDIKKLHISELKNWSFLFESQIWIMPKTENYS